MPILQRELSAFAQHLEAEDRSPGTVGKYHGQKQKKAKKKLKYNSREIPAQLLRASKALSASEVLVRAKEKVAALMRSKATGDYDETEIR